jgi:hypothetical protein
LAVWCSLWTFSIFLLFWYVWAKKNLATQVRVVKKHDFRNIQQKILQISNFAKKRDLKPLPHGNVAAGIAKMFANFFLLKLDFALENANFRKNTDFCKNGILKVFFAKNADFRKKCQFLQKALGNFAEIRSDFCKNHVLLPKNQFLQKKFANIFAMSAKLSPWGKGLESRFLGKWEICGIFCCILQKLCFSTTPFLMPIPKW